MAQTTSALAMTDGTIEVSTNGSSWTDISGSGSTVEPGDQTRQSGEVYTVSGDTAIITGGKREPLELEIKIVYTETAGEAFEVLRAIHEAAPGTIYVRYGRGGSGSFLFTSAKGVLTSFVYPPLMSDDAKPKLLGIKCKVPSVTKSVVP